VAAFTIGRSLVGSSDALGGAATIIVPPSFPPFGVDFDIDPRRSPLPVSAGSNYDHAIDPRFGTGSKYDADFRQQNKR